MTWLKSYLVGMALVVVSLLGHSRHALAQSSKSTCLVAFEEGQRQQLKGNLERAAEQFTQCAASSCPTRVRAECQSFLETTRSPIPGVLFAPVDSVNDRPLDGVSFSVDGRESRVFDGKMVRLEPGEHQVAFHRGGYAAIRLSLTLRASDPPRLVSLRFTPLACSAASKTNLPANRAPAQNLPQPVAIGAAGPIECAPAVESRSLVAPPPPPPTQTAAVPRVAPKRESSGADRKATDHRRTAVLAAGLVAGAGAVGFVYFGLSARLADQGLDACSPHCEPAEVGGIKRDYVMANVSLGVGLAGALTASLLWFTGPGAVRPARVGAESPRGWAIGIGPVTTLATRF